MIKQFLKLEWKAFTRSSSFSTNLALKILMLFGAIYFIVVFIGLGFGSYFLIEKAGLEPFSTINKFIIYYLVFDLIIRFFFQKMPTLTIRPFLNQNIKKNSIVHYTLNKTIVSFFNFIHWFFFIPFTIVLISKGFDALQTITWCIIMLLFLYINNFLSILIDKKDAIFYGVLGLFGVFAILQYYSVFDITQYTNIFFESFHKQSYFVLIPIVSLIGLYYLNFKFFKSNLYLDAGLSIKQDDAKTENYTWLDQLGSLGIFLKNDIRLLKRNKRSRTTLFMSFIFLFYGFIFFNNPTQPPVMGIFAGIFVSGGFLFTFGQFIPSWDSAYYPLMMSQNIPYKDYIKSKWWLMVFATIISTLFASFYLYLGLHTYLLIVVGAIFNIGVNSHLVMLGGAYVKTPIDLSSGKGAFGDKKAFNIKTMLLTIPKLLVPVLLYGLGYFFFTPNIGLVFVAVAGILGFALRNKVFQLIENIYRKEKYATIHAYKQTK